jgi:hypothetical protein
MKPKAKKNDKNQLCSWPAKNQPCLFEMQKREDLLGYPVRLIFAPSLMLVCFFSGRIDNA